VRTAAERCSTSPIEKRTTRMPSAASHCVRHASACSLPSCDGPSISTQSFADAQ
jgi:hypothetical protein